MTFGTRNKTRLSGPRPSVLRLEDRCQPAFGLGLAFAVGSGGVDVGADTTTDAAGNMYAVGAFNNTVDFDPGPGTVTLEGTATAKAFVAKYSPAGSLLWATRLDTPYGGRCVTLLGSALYVNSAIRSGQYQITKLDADSGAVTWAALLSFDARQIAVGPSGNVYVAGALSTAGTAGYVSQAVVTKLGADGSVAWTKYTGPGALGEGLAVDANENVYSTGSYAGTTDFDPGPGTFNLTAIASATRGGTASDAFVWKLDAGGNLKWAKSLGSNGIDYGKVAAVDGSGNVVVTGLWGSNAGTGAKSASKSNDFDPGPGVVQLTHNGGYDVFVASLATDGNLRWARGIGGVSNEEVYDGATDASGGVYTVGGFTGSVDFDPGSGKVTLTSLGAYGAKDIFVSKLTSTGGFADAVRVGGPGSENSYAGVVVDAANNVLVTGGFQGTADFDPGPGTFNLTATAGGSPPMDVFLWKLTQPGSLSAAAPPGEPEAPVRVAEGPSASASGSGRPADGSERGDDQPWVWAAIGSPRGGGELVLPANLGEASRWGLSPVPTHEPSQLLLDDHEASGDALPASSGDSRPAPQPAHGQPDMSAVDRLFSLPDWEFPLRQRA